jgi:hypothetical protein
MSASALRYERRPNASGELRKCIFEKQAFDVEANRLTRPLFLTTAPKIIVI